MGIQENKITGGRINHQAQGAGRKGKGKALAATARKLAVLLYIMMSGELILNEQGTEANPQQTMDRQVKSLIRKAQGLCLTAVPSENAGIQR
jgi:hypothetical protein